MSSNNNQDGNCSANANATSVAVCNVEENSRRHPENLQGVLRYSIEAAGEHVGAESGPRLQPMDQERRTFLEATLRSMTVNPVEQMAGCVKILCESNSQATETLEAALEQLSDMVDNIDNANDFQKIGGFTILAPGLASPHPSVRSLTAHLIGDLSQNNPYIQSKILETELLATLLKLLLEDQSPCEPDENDHPDVKTSSLFALSCIIRGNDEGLRQFSERNGWPVILHVLTSHNCCSHFKLCIKSAFLITSACRYKPDIVDELIEHHFVVQLCSIISDTQPQLLEHLLQALLAMVTNSNRTTELCTQKELQLESTLDKILKANDVHSDEHVYAQQLKDAVFSE